MVNDMRRVRTGLSIHMKRGPMGLTSFGIFLDLVAKSRISGRRRMNPEIIASMMTKRGRKMGR